MCSSNLDPFARHGVERRLIQSLRGGFDSRVELEAELVSVAVSPQMNTNAIEIRSIEPYFLQVSTTSVENHPWHGGSLLH